MAIGAKRIGVRSREVERRPHNHKVPSSIPGCGCQLLDYLLVYTFGPITPVVPRKGNREKLVYFMLSGMILRNIGENIFRSYTGATSKNTDFHVLVA